MQITHTFDVYTFKASDMQKDLETWRTRGNAGKTVGVIVIICSHPQPSLLEEVFPAYGGTLIWLRPAIVQPQL
jgi:hypothetical protein